MTEGLQTFVSHVTPFLKGRPSSAPAQQAPLAIWPTDLWPARSNLGQFLLSGLNEYPSGFNAGVDAFWKAGQCEVRHNFSWLCDLKAMGGDQARQSVRILVASWIERYGARKTKAKNNDAYQDSLVVAQRVLNLLYSYDFHGASASDSYQSLISILVIQDASFLYKKLSSSFANVGGGKDYFFEAQALLSAAICLEDRDDWCVIAEQTLMQALEVQVLQDGGHVSRSPQKLTEMMKACLDVRRLYGAVNRPFPEQIQFAIDRMAQAIKFFRYTDKRLAVFHGGQEYSEGIIDLILHQVGQNKRVVKSLPQTGFERLTQGRSILMVDVGNAPPAPFDRRAHLAPLAFEFSHGKDRIVVNCGTHAKSVQWADALRRTSAHSTLSLDQRDVMDIKESGSIKNRPSQVMYERHEENGAILLDAIHDGYVPLNGMKHARRLYVSDKGQDIRGEDNVFSEVVCERPIAGQIRFHLHPKVRASLVRHGGSALLRLYSGSGWRFEQSGATLSLEESVYMGGDQAGGVPVKTQQLVLTFDIGENMFGTQVKWAFQREK